MKYLYFLRYCFPEYIVSSKRVKILQELAQGQRLERRYPHLILMIIIKIVIKNEKSERQNELYSLKNSLYHTLFFRLLKTFTKAIEIFKTNLNRRKTRNTTFMEFLTTMIAVH